MPTDSPDRRGWSRSFFAPPPTFAILAITTILFAVSGGVLWVIGVNYDGLTGSPISKIHPDEGLRHIGLYIVVLLAGLAIVAAFPWLSTGFLPT